MRGSSNPPFAVQREIASELVEARRRGWINDIEAAALNMLLTNLTDAQGGLERIRNTPLPYQYHSFTRVFVIVYGLVLPSGILTDFGLATPLAALVIAFAFLAFDQAGRHLEDPFADAIYDTPMNSITRTIEINLREAIGETDLPDKIEPVDGVIR